MPDRARGAILRAHREWLGFVQPVGLVVAPEVMADAQVVPDRNIAARQRVFREDLLEPAAPGAAARRAADLRLVFREWLGWEEGDLVPAEACPELAIALPELGVRLAPAWAIPAPPDAPEGKWTMLIGVEDEPGADFSAPPPNADGWNASRHARFERLLRETEIPVGLLCNDECVRLVYAPRGETSGHLTFDFGAMAAPAGRPILAAFDMLLGAGALFGGADEARLPALLAKSREAQAEVSTRLSRQVLAALYELLRGFSAADADAGGGGRFAALARAEPQRLYGGLVTALMRLVFILYAEDRGLMPDHPVHQQHYSLGGLYARLRADAAAWPDTMDRRYGAWAHLLSLFRLVYRGGAHDAKLRFAARKGGLFDPERFPFLKGRAGTGGPADIPPVPDSTVWSMLRNLMMLDGERLSYRTLDVEQIGSVYEAIMGFRVETAARRAIAVRSPKRTGAAVIVDLDALLARDGAGREKALTALTGRKLAGKSAAALRAARTPEDIAAALDRNIDRDATPGIAPPGTPVLQPTDERRRSGSHYTPRALTQPIVADALRPVFERLGPNPKPADILELKILDPAMGSGAFLVEACRQIAERLADAWSAHGRPPALAAAAGEGEDELAHARRLVARRCLYGLDRNPMAVDLAKLSLWLATLAADHEFTFVDHALRRGDFLVGLSMAQIEAVHWKGGESNDFALMLARGSAQKAEAERNRIRAVAADLGEDAHRAHLDRADRCLDDVRLVGDAAIAAFFAPRDDKASARKEAREAGRAKVLQALELGGPRWQDKLAPQLSALQRGARPVSPFHFGIEFPEVFDRENPGFDAIIGNPPFAGKDTIVAANAANYPEWLRTVHSESHGNADLVAHFFRRAFDLLRNGGALGLIATNTIGQGDTRSTGLRWICAHGGTIYRARRRIEWPGEAAVVVSVVHVAKGRPPIGPKSIDGKPAPQITAFLFHDGKHDDPERIQANIGKSFQGNTLRGMGFTFDDTDTKGVATSLSEMRRLIAKNPRNREVIFPYLGGRELNAHPTHEHHRYVINFHDYPLRREDTGELWKDANEQRRQDWRGSVIVPLDYPDPVASDWPDLLEIVARNVKPERDKLPLKSESNRSAVKFWWKFGGTRKGLHIAIAGLTRVLAISRYSKSAACTFLFSGSVYSDSVVAFPFEQFAAFCILQSLPHEIWARFFSSSFGDGLRYTPTDCFETFPFPNRWETISSLEETGKECYEFRSALMIKTNEGMTKIYNRFHDPDERDPKIVELRDLHAAMDRAVLDAYGWTDVHIGREFILDYEVDEEEDQSWKTRPWRYRWPNAVRDDVLARLLALNAERAREERLSGAVRGKPPAPRKRRR